MMLQRSRAAAAPVASLALVGLLAGCSNADSAVAKNPHSGTATASAAAGGIQVVTLTTGPDLRFHPSTFVVHPGKVRVTLVNQAGSGPVHNFMLTQGATASTAFIQPGQQASTTFVAPSPGRYRFVCTIHVDQGQTGVMIVKPAP